MFSEWKFPPINRAPQGTFPRISSAVVRGGELADERSTGEVVEPLAEFAGVRFIYHEDTKSTKELETWNIRFETSCLRAFVVKDKFPRG
jgi:hypothetical protein